MARTPARALTRGDGGALSQLFGLIALDPATFAVALAVVGAMTLLAAWPPARKATKVDPMEALRCD